MGVSTSEHLNWVTDRWDRKEVTGEKGGREAYISVDHICIFQNLRKQETILEIIETASIRRIDILEFGESTTGSVIAKSVAKIPQK